MTEEKQRIAEMLFNDEFEKLEYSRDGENWDDGEDLRFEIVAYLPALFIRVKDD